MPMTKKEYNRRYYAKNSDRIIVRESELRPSTIAELVESISACEPKYNDKRIERLRSLYTRITGEVLAD